MLTVNIGSFGRLLYGVDFDEKEHISLPEAANLLSPPPPAPFIVPYSLAKSSTDAS